MGIFSFGDFTSFSLPSNLAKFPFQPMDYGGPWGSKNLINWNQLTKFMQVGIDVTCMYTNFGGRSLFGFGDIVTFKNGQFSLSDHGLYSPKFNRSESAQKIHASMD